MSSTTGPNTTTCHSAAAPADACGSSSPPRSKPTVSNGSSTPTSSPKPSKPKPHNVWKGSQYEAHVPTVADRVAQTVVALTLEPRTESIFHEDSYGYRPLPGVAWLDGQPVQQHGQAASGAPADLRAR